ncbi:MAG: DUF2783 domain-containing protein [Betaproteobacteria bacterium]|jgi:hypothetical protein
MTTLALHDLEDIYDELAEAIDRVGPEAEAVFLSKLALSLAHHLGDRALVSRLIAQCAVPVDDIPSPDTLSI